MRFLLLTFIALSMFTQTTYATKVCCFKNGKYISKDADPIFVGSAPTDCAHICKYGTPKTKNLKCIVGKTEYIQADGILFNIDKDTENAVCPSAKKEDNTKDCPTKDQNDDPYNPKDVDIQFKKKWKTGATVGGVSGFLLGLIPSKKPSCFLKKKELTEWKGVFTVQPFFQKLPTTTPCYLNAFNLTLQTCGKNPGTPCNTMIQIEKAECGGLDIKAKNHALMRFNKCLAVGGIYDRTTNDCSFKIELKKGKDKEVLETAYVKAGKHTCNKELFEEYHKKRRNNAILRASGGAVVGGVTGGVIEGQITKLWRFLQNQCGVTDKTQAKSVAKNIEGKTHKTVCELIKDLEISASLTQAQAINCVKQLDLKY